MGQDVKRWYRKFNLDIDAETVKAAIANTTDPEVYTKISLAGPWTPPDVDDLVGKTLTFRNEEHVYTFQFDGLNDVKFGDDGADPKACYCNVKTLNGEVYFVNFLVPGYEWCRQITFVPDMKYGYATIVDAHFGTENSNIDVSREFKFGTLDGEFEEGGEPHDFTDELIGKAIEWKYTERLMKIKHSYFCNLYYTYSALAPGGAWAATNPANYTKVRDNLYIFSFVEERQAGLQGLFLIDLDQVHDVGCFFGVSADHVSSACAGAKGEMASTNTIF